MIETLLRTRMECELAKEAIAQRKDLVEALHRTQRQFELAEQMAQIGHWRMDLETQELFWSRQTSAIHAIENPTRAHLESGLDYFLPKDRPRISSAVEECARNGTPYDLELDFRDAKGVLKRVRAIGEQEIVGGKPVGVIGVFQDITERYHLETRLRTAAHVDELTGLPNRARLNQYLDRTIDSASQSGRAMAMLLIDLDHFKEVNDRLGHEAGDRVLKNVAVQLLSEPFANQLSARLGGDEFVMVIENEALLLDLEGSMQQLLDKLRMEIGEGEDRMQVSATIGAAWLTHENNERSALMRCADHALYQAKRKERGTSTICSEAVAGERLTLRPQLRAVG